MAFRELTEKELELLTDSQWESYERKLEIHRERVRFVEQLERMEQVEIPSFQPTLNPIAPISGAPEMTFVQTEHSIAQMPEVPTHIVQVHARSVAPVEQAVIPQVPTKLKVRTVKVDAQFTATPVLPEHRPVRLLRREFQATEPVRAKVPDTAAVQPPDVTFVGAETIKARVPTVVKPVPVDCPRIALDENAAKPRSVSAPAAVRPKARIIRNEPPKISALPEATVVRPAGITYVAPVVSAAVTNPVSVAACPQKNYQNPPEVSVAPPAVVKARVHKSTYHVPEIQKTEAVASVLQVKVPERIVVQPVVSGMQPAHPATVHTPKINYEKQEFEVAQLPQADAVRIPDPQTNEILHNLLKKANEK